MPVRAARSRNKVPEWNVTNFALAWNSGAAASHCDAPT
jgi:hypothetical protein